jgi:hypothetical protein
MNDARASKLRELLGYGPASATALAVDVSILALLVELAGCTFATNFSLRRNLLFAAGTPARP